jgi:hypothetical protein
LEIAVTALRVFGTLIVCLPVSFSIACYAFINTDDGKKLVFRVLFQDAAIRKYCSEFETVTILGSTFSGFEATVSHIQRKRCVSFSS